MVSPKNLSGKGRATIQNLVLRKNQNPPAVGNYFSDAWGLLLVYLGHPLPGERGPLKFWGRSRNLLRDPFGCTLGGRGFDSSRIVSRTGLNLPPGSRLRRRCARVGSPSPGSLGGNKFRAAESRPPQKTSGQFFTVETAMLLPSGSRAVD